LNEGIEFGIFGGATEHERAALLRQLPRSRVA
jgi:hypothetical protein